jgi:hypothetical protein
MRRVRLQPRHDTDHGGALFRWVAILGVIALLMMAFQDSEYGYLFSTMTDGLEGAWIEQFSEVFSTIFSVG